MRGKSISRTPGGGGPTLRSPWLRQSSAPLGLSQRKETVCAPTSAPLPFMWTTRFARGWTAGSAATCSASNTPRTLSFPSCERFAASANRANATRIQQHRQAKARTPSFLDMGSSAGDAATESILPGRADTARPGGGVWLTDASLVLVAIIWGVNFSVVKFGTSLIDPLAYNGVRVL